MQVSAIHVPCNTAQYSERTEPMIYSNSFVSDVLAPVGVTDEMIRKMCPVEIDLATKLKKGEAIEDRFYENPAYAKPGMTMGRMDLAHPVVNPNYLFGSRPLLPSLTGRSRKDLKALVYDWSALITASQNSDFPEGKILPYKEAEMLLNENVKIAFGAEAVEFLLIQQGHSTEGIILHTIPVLPIDLLKQEGEETEIAQLTFRAAKRIYRLHQMKNISGGTPAAIQIDEERLIQQAVISLFSNGLKCEFIGAYGTPYTSYYELYNLLNHNLSGEAFRIAESTEIPTTPDEDQQLTSHIRELLKIDRTNFAIAQESEEYHYQEWDDEKQEVVERTLDSDQIATLKKNYGKYKDLQEQIVTILRRPTDAYLHQFFPTYTDFYDSCMLQMRKKVEEALSSAAANDDERVIMFLTVTGIGKRIAMWLSKNISVA